MTYAPSGPWPAPPGGPGLLPPPPAGPALLPPPPAGPGVRPPFVAPPTDGNRRRLWTGLISAAVIAVIICGGGVAGFAALVNSTVDARSSAATKAVTEFLIDIQHNDFAGAYRAQCSELRDQLSFNEFTATFTGAQLISFRTHEPELFTDETVVPSDLTFGDGTQTRERIVVVDDDDGVSRVCGDE